MAIFKANYVKRGKTAKSLAKASIRYIQHRRGKDGHTITRDLFNTDGLLDRYEASPFNIVIGGRDARTSTHNCYSRIRCLEAVLLCDRMEIGRGNVSTHVESPEV